VFSANIKDHKLNHRLASQQIDTTSFLFLNRADIESRKEELKLVREWNYDLKTRQRTLQAIAPEKLLLFTQL